MLAIIKKEFLDFLRDPTSLFFCILFPCLLVFLLGSFLQEVEVNENAIGELDIVYSVGGEQASASHFESFIESLEADGILTAERMTNEDGFSGAIADGISTAVAFDDGEIIVYSGKDSVKSRTVKVIFDTYNQMSASYATAASVDPSVLTGAIPDGEYVHSNAFGASRSMMDYYAVTMLVMIMFMGGCISGSSSYYSEHRFCTIGRLNISCVSRLKVFLGKTIGAFPMVLIQTAGVMLTSTLLFGARYCDTFLENAMLAVMFLSASIAALSFGLLLNLFFQKVALTGIILPVLWIAMFLSGTFYKDMYIEGLSDYMPMNVIQKAAFDLTVFSRSEKAIIVTLCSLGLFIVFLTIGVFKETRRRTQ